MATPITYGHTKCLFDSLEATQLIAQPTEVTAVDQVAACVRSQLAQPIDYPPLAQATIPGDRIAIAVAPGTPQQAAVIDGALQALHDAHTEAELITIVLSESEQRVATLKAELARLGHEKCQVKRHDPDDEKGNAYLGATEAGQPLRLNRDLCEADLVLPITTTKAGLAAQPRESAIAGLFPEFSERETIERIATAAAAYHPETCPDNLTEIEFCLRQLGVGIAIEVVPGPAGEIATLYAGDPTTIAQQAHATFRQIWQAECEVRGNLVIATLTGAAEQQTWHNVATAIAAAETVLESDGVIVVYSELSDPPGRAIGLLADSDDYLTVEREILHCPSSDSYPAVQLCRALQRSSIYLRSQLRPSVVANLGITPIESDSELERLSQSHRPCVVLEEAQRLHPYLVESKV